MKLSPTMLIVIVSLAVVLWYFLGEYLTPGNQLGAEETVMVLLASVAIVVSVKWGWDRLRGRKEKE